MGYAPSAGEKCRVVVPVRADYAQMRGHAVEVKEQATEALYRICKRNGFTATNQELVWSGSVAAARNSPHARAVSQIPDDMHVFVFEATAA
jgi:hypothetical protein